MVPIQGLGGEGGVADRSKARRAAQVVEVRDLEARRNHEGCARRALVEGVDRLRRPLGVAARAVRLREAEDGSLLAGSSEERTSFRPTVL